MNEKEFIKSLNEFKIEVSDNQLDQLKKYYEYLIEYNITHNLTSITKKEDVYLKHFYDSITLVKAIDLLNVETVCDVGTGAGFPGIILKIFFPNIKLTLIESTTKKVNFLVELVNLLNLENVQLINARAEQYSLLNREKFDLVTCRAVSQLNIISEYCVPLVKKGGHFIPMKSDIKEEMKNSSFLEQLDCIIEKIIEFNLPIENSKRTLLIIKKLKITDNKYPRSYKAISENPL